ncbi:hypothetical protein BDQ94DRAFT_164573 [Aspergillus welwitschiae]|uniref:Uncharacterized protein n=1 Tax=Aspergillus welwitschiae TaxID=1341132 RepID=A0A3F3PI15_9EURO|nr:hypothetical protein BDQ94DRAFT_164573 [Aspergillus welwitschiae]RDH26332.1 hypothetical protein BDQ94DRAFT_164573 [Aspergillus welwitschiae]
MANLSMKEETPMMIIRKSTTRYICPPFFEFFPQEDLLNRHIYEWSDYAHAGLRNRLDGTNLAAENIPPVTDCFAVDSVVEHYHFFPHTMASLQRRVETLKRINQVSSIYFQGEDAHARPVKRTAKEQWEMEMHAGLAKRTSRKQWDMEKFLTCYRQSVRTSMAVEDISPNCHCFEVNFVVEHYREHTGSQHKVCRNMPAGRSLDHARL